MQGGTLDGSDVLTRTSRVLVNGVQRPHISWSIDREIPGGLPAQVISGGGITQATGTIVWGDSTDVVESGGNPWRPATAWVPTKGSRVEIFAGDGVTEWKQFHGVIDSTTGSIGGGMQSKIIDDYDKLSAPVTLGPLLAVMPPRVQGGAFRGTGLVSTYYVDAALRAAGFYLTPKREADCVLDVPCQGGMFPHTGSTHEAATQSGVGSYPANRYRPGGFAVSDFDMMYLPAFQRSASTPLQMTLMVTQGHAGFAYMRCRYLDGQEVQLSVNADRIASVQVGGAILASLTVPEGSVISALIRGGNLTLKTSDGQSATSAAGLSGPALLDTIVLVGDDGVRVAGVQVSHPPTAAWDLASVNFSQTATINTSDVSFLGVMRACRAIDAEPAGDLLSEISEATLASMWIDELGVFQWWPALALKGRTASGTVTTADDILSLDWEDSLLGSRSRVTVRHEVPALKLSRFQNIELWSGSGGVLESGETLEEFIGPSAGQAWITPSGNFKQMRMPGDWWQYNRPRGSLSGGYYTLDDAHYPHTNLTLDVSMETVSVTRFKVTHVAGTYPEDVVVNLETPNSDELWDRNRNKALPRVAGYGFVEWVPQDYSQPAVGGVGPELVHETGIWVPQDIVNRYSDYLSAETAVPKPTITGLEVVYDPRRQLGDVVTLSSPSLMGVELTALIVGISNSASDSGMSQSLSVRIISSTSTALTYAEFNTLAQNASLSYEQWQALGPVPETYQQFNNAA